MNLDDLAGSTLGALTRRFFLVSFLPLAAAAFCVLMLAWAGAPAPELDFVRAWRTATGLSVAELTALVAAVLFLALLIHPLQLRVMRYLEGHWPGLLGPLATLFRRRQEAHLRKLAAQEEVPDDPTPEQVLRAGQAGTRLRRTYPSGQPLSPTLLGNVMAAAEERAGAAYGWDAVVAWPRLYPLVPDQTRQVVDDRRNTLDLAAMTAAVATILGVVAVALLWRSGWALLLAAVPIVVARLAYRGAVNAAYAYGESLDATFDLHRFELFTAMRLDLPADPAAERRAAQALCDFWRQGVPLDAAYRHP